MAFQEQNIKGSSVKDSSIQQVRAGRDAVSFQNSHGNQVTIKNIVVRLFNKPEPPQVDWDWAQKILNEQLAKIHQRLVDTLDHDRTLMDISAEEQPSWVNRPLQAKRTLRVDSQDCGLLDASKLLIETFGRDDVAGKLLILGAPGSGKTTALLSLAEQLLNGALAQSKTVIPVLFELSTWRDDNQSIHNWLVEQLYDLYGGKPRYRHYESWLEQRVLLPLLDGLDELELERQKKCIIKLKEFAKHHPYMVVCCRDSAFKAADIQFDPLRNAVCLQPLSDKQIEDYLCSQNRSELWSAIQAQPDLRKLLEPTTEGDSGLFRVPLFLKLAADVYDPQKPILNKSDLLEKYIEKQLCPKTRKQDRCQVERRKWAYKTVEEEPDWRQVCKTLSWVAL
jgi:predicted NACHT family NTPase